MIMLREIVLVLALKKDDKMLATKLVIVHGDEDLVSISRLPSRYIS